MGLWIDAVSLTHLDAVCAPQGYTTAPIGLDGALLAAVEAGRQDRVLDLISQFGVGPLLQSDIIGEAMVAAAGQEKVGMLRLLLDLGAPANARGGPDRRTALHEAVLKRRCKAVRLLLRNEHVDVNARTRSGCTPLWCAADMGFKTVLQLLLDCGRAELDVKAIRLTALQVARKNGHFKCCKMLRHAFCSAVLSPS